MPAISSLLLLSYAAIDSTSHLQLSGGKPSPRVVVEGNNAIFTIGWPVLWTGLDDVVQGLFWMAAVARGGVPQPPAFHGHSKAAYTCS